MDRTLHIVGRNSSELIMLRYPRSLLNFCDYDLTYFAENAIAVCDEGLRSGELDFDRVTDLRNSLKNAHVLIEANLRTTYDKIVLDCWIDYVCRRDNVGVNSLWSRFMPCGSAFEKAVFTRLCDYRYNRAINEWLNVVRVQDYAKSKIGFVFSLPLNSAAEAAARRNYFDLMLSVTARELGCRNEDLGVTKVFSVGRIPSAPFVFTNISKDVVKNLLSEFDYSEDYTNTGDYGATADKIAMNAFSYMKAGLANEYQSYNMSRTEMENAPQKVYMPCGLKAAVDLEIDALIESGGWLYRCKRCGRYFVRDAEHMEEYCSLFNPGGKTCLEIYEIENPKSYISAELQKRYRDITDEMYSRVGASLSLHEYESWKVYLDALHDKVENGEIPPDELEAFIIYSSSLDISRSNPVTEVKKPEPEPLRERERVVKPFVPQRIDRSEIDAQRPVQKPIEEQYEYEDIPRPKAFFTSPTVQRQKAQEAPTRIIRGEQAAESLSRQPQSFTPFGTVSEKQDRQEQPSTQPQKQRYYAGGREEPAAYQPYVGESFGGFSEFSKPAASTKPAEPIPPAQPEPSVQSDKPAESAEFDFQRIGEKLRELQEMEQKSAAPETAVIPKLEEQPASGGFELFGDISYDHGDGMETGGNAFDFGNDYTELLKPAEFEAVSTMQSSPEPDSGTAAPQTVSEQPRPRVIRKNAAAMSAYGRISGAPLVTQTEAMGGRGGYSAQQNARTAESTPSPTQQAAPTEEKSAQGALSAVDNDPFRNIGSIFDVLEQSQDDGASAMQESGDSYFVFDRERTAEIPQPPAPAAEKPAEEQQQEKQAAVNHEKPQKAKKQSKSSRSNKEQYSKADAAVSISQPELKSRTVPEKVTADNVPSGIWTEERNLFPEEHPHDNELEMLKDKKHQKSHKTQRLFDAIMREPEDNPNVRKKK